MDQELNEVVSEIVIGILLLKASARPEMRLERRTEKTTKELNLLEAVFMLSTYPDYITKKSLSVLLGMNQKTIQIWFQNKRRYLQSDMKRTRVLRTKTNWNHLGSKNMSFPQTKVSSKALLLLYMREFGI